MDPSVYENMSEEERKKWMNVHYTRGHRDVFDPVSAASDGLYEENVLPPLAVLRRCEQQNVQQRLFCDVVVDGFRLELFAAEDYPKFYEHVCNQLETKITDGLCLYYTRKVRDKSKPRTTPTPLIAEFLTVGESDKFTTNTARVKVDILETSAAHENHFGTSKSARGTGYILLKKLSFSSL
jgi:hypothetical protein